MTSHTLTQSYRSGYLFAPMSPSSVQFTMMYYALFADGLTKLARKSKLLTNRKTGLSGRGGLWGLLASGWSDVCLLNRITWLSYENER